MCRKKVLLSVSVDRITREGRERESSLGNLFRLAFVPQYPISLKDLDKFV